MVGYAMNWFDIFLLPTMVLLPCLGACFVALMPPTDRISLRHLGMGTSILAGLCSLRIVWLVLETGSSIVFNSATHTFSLFDLPLLVEGLQLPFLLCIHIVCPMALRAGAPRIGHFTRSYVILILLFQAIAAACLLCRNPLPSLFFAQLLSIPALMLLVFFGGPRKGSTALRVGIFWVTADVICFAALLYLAGGEEITTAQALTQKAEQLPYPIQIVLGSALIASGAIRLGLVPFSSWIKDVLEQAPVSLAALIVGVILPLGGFLAFRWAMVIVPEGVEDIFPIWVLVSLVGAALGACLAVIERDLRSVVAAHMIFFVHIAFMGLVSRSIASTTSAVMLLGMMGLTGAFAIFLIDALDRRIQTRDVTELNGLASQCPPLWRLLIFAHAMMTGAPFLGIGMVLAPTLFYLGLSISESQGNLWNWNGVIYFSILGVLWVLLFTSFTSLLRRTLMPRPKSRQFVGLNVKQTLRLWIPAWLVVLFSVFAPWFTEQISALHHSTSTERTSLSSDQQFTPRVSHDKE